VAESG